MRVPDKSMRLCARLLGAYLAELSAYRSFFAALLATAAAGLTMAPGGVRSRIWGRSEQGPANQTNVTEYLTLFQLFQGPLRPQKETRIAEPRTAAETQLCLQAATETASIDPIQLTWHKMTWSPLAT
jgi:hypothetical protein